MYRPACRLLVAVAAFVACGTASAMIQCESLDPRLCATPAQKLLLLLLPWLLAVSVVVLARRFLARPWLRLACMVLTVFLCIAWELGALVSLEALVL